MSGKPLVSVCVITYNQAMYVRETLDSILNQQVNFAWEIVVADDCSKDNTQDIVREYADKHPGLFKLVLQEKNVGPGRNFLDLYNAASGKYIAYIEGDDYWTDPLKLQKQFNFLEANPDFSLSYHKVLLQWDYEPDKKDAEGVTNEGDKPVAGIHDLLNIGWFIRSCSMFFRNIPLPPDFEKLYVGDYPLHLLLADKGKIGFIDECMAVYRIHQKGVSETMLLSKEIHKQRQIFRNVDSMLDYMNLHTGYKYNNEFRERKVSNISSHLQTIIKRDKGAFVKDLIYISLTFPGLLVSQFFRRLMKPKKLPVSSPVSHNS